MNIVPGSLSSVIMLLGSKQWTVRENGWDVQKRYYKTTKNKRFLFCLRTKKFLFKRQTEKWKHFNSWSHKLWEVTPAKSNWIHVQSICRSCHCHCPTTWVGLDECEVAYINDFRWSTEIIAWIDFLLLLEGQKVHLPQPKNQ